MAANVTRIHVTHTGAGTAWRRRTARAGSGQSTVEFALVVVPFLLVLMGIFDLGRAIFYNHLVANAAREAARAGVTTVLSQSAVCEAARRAAHLPSSGVGRGCGRSESLTVDADVGAPGGQIFVRLTYDYRPVTPLIGRVLPQLSLESSTTMYVEQ